MRSLIPIMFLTVFMGCTTHQKVESSIEESNRVIKERAEGAKKVMAERFGANPHKILEISIPQVEVVGEVKKESADEKHVFTEDVFVAPPKGMIKRSKNDRKK